MSTALTNRRWRLARRPQGEIAAGDLAFTTVPVPALAQGEVLVRNIYLSLDPTHRIWMSDQDQYLPPVEIGAVMRGGGIGVVEDTRSERFARGDIVSVGLGGWEDFTVASERQLGRVRRLDGVPLTAHLCVLGSTGLTAWYGMVDIGQPKAGETVVVSAAAGAVGSIAGQLAKRRGARVVGIAGGAAKCRWLVDDLGFDAAIDYRAEDTGAALDRHCPDGIDVNFENVGGATMDAVIARMNTYGRVALCGMISTYNRNGPVAGPADFARVLMRRITIRGFIVIDFLPRAREALAELTPLVASGELKWKAHVVDGLENAPDALQLLFTGAHDGKLMVRISPEP